MQEYDIELDPDFVKLLKNMADASSEQQMNQLFVKFFDYFALLCAGNVTKKFLSGDPVHRRTGQLAASTTGKGVLEGGVPGMRVGVFRGPALKYAGIINQGTKSKNPTSQFADIVPKNAKALAIPVNDALTPAGVARWGGPREYPGKLIFIRWNSKNPNVIGALYDVNDLDKTRARGLRNRLGQFKRGGYDLSKVKALYLLMTRVGINPTHYLEKGVLDYLPNITIALQRYMLKVILNGKSANQSSFGNL